MNQSLLKGALALEKESCHFICSYTRALLPICFLTALLGTQYVHYMFQYILSSLNVQGLSEVCARLLRNTGGFAQIPPMKAAGWYSSFHKHQLSTHPVQINVGGPAPGHDKLSFPLWHQHTSAPNSSFMLTCSLKGSK